MPKPSSSSVEIFFPRFDRQELIDRIRADLPDLRARLPVTRVVLFGSYATGRHTAASDIDVLVVYAGNPHPDAFSLVKKSLPVPGLEPHIYTQTEAEAVRGTLTCMTRDGVVLLRTDAKDIARAYLPTCDNV